MTLLHANRENFARVRGATSRETDYETGVDGTMGMKSWVIAVVVLGIVAAALSARRISKPSSKQLT